MLNVFLRLSFLLLILLSGLCVSVPAWAETLKIGCYPKQNVISFLKEHNQGQVDQFYRVTLEGRKKTTVTAEHNGSGYIKGGIAYMVETDRHEACVNAKMRVLHMGPDALDGKTFFTDSDKDVTSEGCKAASKTSKVCPHYNTLMSRLKASGEKVILQGIGFYDAKDGTEKESAILETIIVDPAENGTGELLFSDIPVGATYSMGLFNRSATLSPLK